MIKIFIADDHKMFRKALKLMISESPKMAVADEAGSGKDVLEKVESNTYDIILLDPDMRGRNGFDIMKQIKNKKPDLPILVVSMNAEEQYALPAFKAGAAGYVAKINVPEELITAIRAVVSGRKYISSSMSGMLSL